MINVNTKKRLHVASDICFSTKPVYDKSFADYEKYLDEYDLKNNKEFKKLLSDRFSELKKERTLNSEKYKLSEKQKEFLANICYMYNFPVTIVLKDGILCIHSTLIRKMVVGLFSINDCDRKETIIETVCYFVDFISRVIEEFMNI